MVSESNIVRLSVAGMLFMGTIKTLLNKLMYGIHAKGIDGSVHSFEVRRSWSSCLSTWRLPLVTPVSDATAHLHLLLPRNRGICV